MGRKVESLAMRRCDCGLMASISLDILLARSAMEAKDSSSSVGVTAAPASDDDVYSKTHPALSKDVSTSRRGDVTGIVSLMSSSSGDDSNTSAGTGT